jgi:hypothetical protein
LFHASNSKEPKSFGFGIALEHGRLMFCFCYVFVSFFLGICHDFVMFLLCTHPSFLFPFFFRDCDGRYEYMDKNVSLDGFKHPRLQPHRIELQEEI